MSVGIGVVDDPRLLAGRHRAGEPGGWHRMYARGFSVAAHPDFARDWLVRHLPFQAAFQTTEGDRIPTVVSREPVPAVRVSYRRLGLDRFTEWDLSSTAAVIATDSVWKGRRLEILGREEHRFMGNANGSIVEVTIWRKPVSLVSRLGFGLFPTASGNPVEKELEKFQALDREFRQR